MGCRGIPECDGQHCEQGKATELNGKDGNKQDPRHDLRSGRHRSAPVVPLEDLQPAHAY